MRPRPGASGAARDLEARGRGPQEAQVADRGSGQRLAWQGHRREWQEHDQVVERGLLLAMRTWGMPPGISRRRAASRRRLGVVLEVAMGQTAGL
eukprot:1125380-Pyramimonas_sp.AAC.1